MAQIKQMIEKYKADKFITGAVFAFYLFITCYKLTNAPLWFDETIEYWYSKIMFGTLPFEGAGTGGSMNMYERIISTYQPPLYNFIMYFWLKVSDSEWWFRFFGVVMGFIGMLGIYNSVKKLGKSTAAASGAVLFSSCTYILVYYWQECAEYCLMAGSLCWTIYFWISLMQEVSRKNIILFTMSAVIPVYSQYGALFPVSVMALTAFIYVLSKRDRKNNVDIIASYACAFVFAAVPLYIFFLKKQMAHQQGGSVSLQSISFEKGIVQDIFSNLFVVFKCNMTSYYTDETTTILLAVVLLAFGIVLIKGGRLVKWIVGVNIFTWMIYYLAVKTGVYSYGSFGNRYNLFFVPLWIISGFAVFMELYEIVKANCFLVKKDVHIIYAGILMCFIFCFCIWGWEAKLQGNWGKQDNKGAVNAWYQQNAAEKDTIVYYAADSGFAYYVRANSAYDSETEKNVVYMYWYRDRSEDEYREYINSVYGDIWPEEVYIVASHTRDDLNTLVNQFVHMGYVREDIYNSADGRLIKLTYHVLTGEGRVNVRIYNYNRSKVAGVDALKPGNQVLLNDNGLDVCLVRLDEDHALIEMGRLFWDISEMLSAEDNRIFLRVSGNQEAQSWKFVGNEDGSFCILANDEKNALSCDDSGNVYLTEYRQDDKSQRWWID